MRLVEISANSNGAHANQVTTAEFKKIPEGWAVIPEEMETPNFPFGEIETKEIDGIMTVTNWVAGEVPEKSEEEAKPTTVEQLRADVDYIAIMTGVEL